MLLRQRIAGLDHRDEFYGHEVRPLVEQLEHRMLRVGPDPAPGDRRGRPSDRLAVDGHALAVRFHFELLEIGRQQAQPLVIGEGRARLGVADLRVIKVGERREHWRVLAERGLAEMAVHFACTFEQFLEAIPPERDCRRKADRRPQRIAPADALGKRQDAGFVDTPFDRLVGVGGQRDDAAIGILHAMLAHPLQHGIGVGQRFLGGEGLGRDHQQRRGRIELREHFLQRRAVDVRDDRHLITAVLSAQRIDQQIGPERRSTDADVQHVADFPQRPGLDRIDQRAHPGVQHARPGDILLAAFAALGDVRHGAALAGVDHLAREQRLALAVEVLRLGQRGERRDRIGGQMRLRPVEM